jgi:selenocysteine lyase/cysteine desulfurase
MLRPTVFGGTGRDSRVVSYADGEWEYEPGTPNGPGLAGLLAGASYVMERGVDNICRQLYGQIKALIELMEEIPHVRLYCPERSEHGPLVSFNVEGLDPADVGYILQNVYGITVRTGLHCAPLCHKHMGTFPHGTVRVSISTFNSTRDIESLIDALKEITSSL